MNLHVDILLAKLERVTVITERKERSETEKEERVTRSYTSQQILRVKTVSLEFKQVKKQNEQKKKKEVVLSPPGNTSLNHSLLVTNGSC